MTMATPGTSKTRSLAAREAQARKAMRIVAIIGTIPVVVVAGYASYFHITELAVRHGQSQSIAHMMAVPIDMMMVVAAVATIAHRTALFPKLAFGAGAVLTLAANILSVQHADPVAYVMAAVPALSLLLSADMLLRLILPAPAKRRRTARKPVAKPATVRTRALRSVSQPA